MPALTQNELQHIFQSLRMGLVPERGIDTFAVGVEVQRKELDRQLTLISHGDGSIKFLRGGYGCGKTFMARLALQDAQAKGYATSFVVVSDNDLKFHKFEDVYRKVIGELSTRTCPRGALDDILDRWISKVEDALIAAGADEEAPGFDDRVRERLDQDLASMTTGQASADFIRVIQTIFDCKQESNAVEASALVSWLSGSQNVSAELRRRAGVKGRIGSREAFDFLRSVLSIVKAAGYEGLVIVIDEAETLLRSRSDVRARSLNGIRQITDAAGSFPGLLWLFTGTPEFYDTQRGCAGLAPLHDRISFQSQGSFASVRQAQLQLKPFDRDRLRAVAIKLRGMYPTDDPHRRDARVSDDFIERLVDEVTQGLRGDVGVVPRHFLREFVNQLDLVDENASYEPSEHYTFQTKDLNPTERARLAPGVPAPVAAADDGGLTPVEDVW